MGIASQFKSQKGIFLHRQLRAHPKSVLIMDFVKLWAGLCCQQCSGQHEHSTSISRSAPGVYQGFGKRRGVLDMFLKLYLYLTNIV